jgi:chorismate mutase
MNNLLQKFIDDPSSFGEKESTALLEELRNEVNDIDIQVTRLLIRRIKLSLYISKVKRVLGLQSFSPEREEKILNNVLSQAPDELSRKILRNIYERIIDESRGIQKLRSEND